MRTDSTAGQIIGALARASSGNTPPPTHGLNRDSKVGLFVSALARESMPATPNTLVGGSIVALIEARAISRNFMESFDWRTHLILNAANKLNEMPKGKAIYNLLGTLREMPDPRQTRILQLRQRSLRNLATELSRQSRQFRHEISKLTRLTRDTRYRDYGYNHLVYAYRIINEIIVAANEAAYQTTALAKALRTASHRATLIEEAERTTPRAEILYLAIIDFNRAVADLLGFATIIIDATEADLSSLKRYRREDLAGVMWTNQTSWPPSLIYPVRAWSSEIKEGVFMIGGGNEREPSELALI